MKTVFSIEKCGCGQLTGIYCDERKGLDKLQY